MTRVVQQSSRLCMLFFMVISLAACGFHLRGQIIIPDSLKVITLSSASGSNDFDRDLRIALKKAGVTVLDKAQASADIPELKVNAISTSDTTLATNSDNDITQIERRLSAVYFIRNNQGKALYGPRTVSTSKSLANQNAEESTKLAYNQQQTEGMYEDLVSQLLSDLSYSPL